MDLLASPAWLGGVMLCVALSAWLIGHCQGLRLATPAAPEARSLKASASPCGETPVAPVAAPATPLCQREARGERLHALSQSVSLGALHAEVSAYRMQERILVGLPDNGWGVDYPLTASRTECRYRGFTDHAVCGITVMPERCSPSCRSAVGVDRRSKQAPQPSLDFGAFTRV